MKIKLSQDQNTLEVDGVIFEAKPVTSRDLCFDCAFYEPVLHVITQECQLTAKAGYCNCNFRKDKQDIIWVKKYEN